jgi:signal transduction protein with GAF and PtsI domain
MRNAVMDPNQTILRKLAEMQVEMQADMHFQLDEMQAKMQADTRSQLDEMRTATKLQFTELRQEMHAGFSELRTDMVDVKARVHRCEAKIESVFDFVAIQVNGVTTLLLSIDRSVVKLSKRVDRLEDQGNPKNGKDNGGGNGRGHRRP